MEFLKDDLPAMETSDMEQVFDKVFSMDISKKLDAYEVEYRVIQEELIHAVSKVSNSSTSTLNSKVIDKTELEKQIKNENIQLRHEVSDLTSQIHVYQSKCYQLQSSCDNYLSTIKRLELRLRVCEDERDAFMHSVKALQRRNEKLEAITNADSNKNDSEGQTKTSGGKQSSNDQFFTHLTQILYIITTSDRNSLSQTPVFSISCAKNDNKKGNEDDDQEEVEYEEDEDEEDEDEDEDDIDINYDEDEEVSKEDKDSDNFVRTQSDTSNLSI
jgi:cob(I)alamin adenosyltransferase